MEERTGKGGIKEGRGKRTRRENGDIWVRWEEGKEKRDNGITWRKILVEGRMDEGEKSRLDERKEEQGEAMK